MFDRALAEYMRYTPRTLQSVINTKAYFVARKAIWFTQKADIYRMRAQLGQFVRVNYISRHGKQGSRKILTLVNSSRATAPLAALIINARRGKAGLPGLYGSKMARAIRELLASRMKAVAFIKSGWLPAVRILAPHAEHKGSPRVDASARQRGRPKGTAKPAQSTWRPTAEIVNLVTAKRDTKMALVKYGSPGLQRAFTDEAASMRDYIERRMRPDASRFNAAQR